MNTLTGQVLGAETMRDVKELVTAVLAQTWQEQFTTREMWMMAVASVVTILFMITTFMHFYFHKAAKVKTAWWKLPLSLVLNLILFPAFIVGQLYANNFFQYVRAPRSVQYVRAVPQILSISYRTYDPTYSIVAWGYDPNHLDNLELGVSALNKSRKHEFNIPVQASSTVYFRIKSGSEFYGQNRQIPGKVYELPVPEKENKK